MFEINEENIQKLWGSQEEYYKEKKDFLTKHMDAGAHITVTAQGGCLVSATYYFAPYTVIVDRNKLLEALRDAITEEADDEQEG